jgi:alpha-tubulin suppressor-like RCC1 family protein
LSFAFVRAGTGNNTYLTTCGITTSGAAYCWGSNSKGQVGATSSDNCSSGGVAFVCAFLPTGVQGLGTVTVIDASRDHSCAMAADRTLYCWGDNTFGELGNGTTTSSTTPVVVHLPST